MIAGRGMVEGADGAEGFGRVKAIVDYLSSNLK